MLRRLCPVPSVRNGAADAGASGGGDRLSDMLASGTQDVHAASDALIRARSCARVRATHARTR